MRYLVCTFGLAGVASLGAQRPAAPQPDIFLAPLSIQAGRVTVGTPVNVTHRDGYDNQPSFTPNGRAILFTSTHDDGQSDIYRYDIATQATTRVTTTPESEYSASVMPGGKRFSVIRVEKDSAQRLWSFAMDGSDPRLVVESLKPVGYHVWADSTTLAMFVLGSPNALVLGDLRTGKMDTVAHGIGRSLARVPGGFSFVEAVSRTESRLKTMMLPSRVVADVTTLPGRAQDIAWLSDGSLLAGDGAKLVTWHAGASAWTDVIDLRSAGLSDITRLAVSPDGKWLALVANPSP
jgi:dipeptidyl aminopeptidase/acylaminoacyl peptidase